MSLENQTLPLRHAKSITTVETLANAVELSKAVLREVVGNEIADTINNAPLTDSLYNSLIVIELRKNLTPSTGV